MKNSSAPFAEAATSPPAVRSRPTTQDTTLTARRETPNPVAAFRQTERIEATRIDQWLWAVRMFKTRSLATAACKGGHVRINGNSAKPASPVRAGDRVEARVADRDRVLEVARLIEKRVSAPLASECFVDHSPPAPRREYVAPLFRRDPGTGRPTKKDRRAMDRFRKR